MISPLVYWALLIIGLGALAKAVMSPVKKTERIILLGAGVTGIGVDLIRSGLESSSPLLDTLFMTCFVVMIMSGLWSMLLTSRSSR